MEDKEIFNAWLKAMDWHKRGGREEASEALGKNPSQITRYKNGTSPLSKETRLAMTAIAQNLKPWDPKNEGLPAVHMSISLG